MVINVLLHNFACETFVNLAVDNKLQPLLMTQDPIRKSCQEIVSTAVVRRLNCFVPAFVCVNRTIESLSFTF